MNTNPWERLREAASMPSFGASCTMRVGRDPLRVELANGPSDDQRGFYAQFRRPEDAARFVAVHNALAALPATPPQQPVPDEERERAIGDIRDRLYRALENGETTGEVWISTAHRNLIDAAVVLMRSAPAQQPVPASSAQWQCARCGYANSGPICTKCMTVPAPQPPSLFPVNADGSMLCNLCQRDPCVCGKPAPSSPASDWRERFEASRNSTAETLCLRDGLIAAEDRIAAVEDRLAKIERGDA